MGSSSCQLMPYARFRFGPFELDAAERRLTGANGVVALAPRAFDLLGYLLQHAGRLVTKRVILDHVWAGAVVTENALTQSVRQIRAALGDDPDQPIYIEMVPRVGYRFVAAVTLLESAPDVPKPAPRPEYRDHPARLAAPGLALATHLATAGRVPMAGRGRSLCVQGEALSDDATLLDQHGALFDAFFRGLPPGARVTVAVIEEHVPERH